MDCKVFNNKLEDMQKGILIDEMEEAMNKHMEKCFNCNKINETENNMTNTFSDYFNIDKIEYKSSRNEIMKRINKGKYTKSPINKIKHILLRNKRKYLGTAAGVILLFIMLPFLNNMSSLGNGSMKTDMKAEMKDTAKGIGTENKESIEVLDNLSKVNYYKIKKEEALVMISEDFNSTKAVSSPDNKRRAMIYGKGYEIQEEGYSKVILQDLIKDEYYIIEANDIGKQITVKSVLWKDNNSILAIIGMAYGTVTKGGNLYNLNLNTKEISLIYETKDKKTEVTKIEKINDGEYYIFLNEYTDNDLTKSKTYQEKIKISP